MGMGGLGDMMKQIQKMQAKMEEMQAQLEKATVEGSVRRRHGQSDHQWEE